ncbi:MAG: hypothetical protein K0Q79_1493 [Flavipsychrobacter sp.]|jgi:hypothetical protein|nr:hypothetical protein [Flavipsychrobacter sp.]
MKKTDLTQPGGFPLDQNQLNHLQQGYIECLTELALVLGSSTTPFAIRGCAITRTPTTGTLADYSIAAGSIFWNGEIVLNPSTVVLTNVDESVDGLYVEIIPNNAALTYYDSSSPTVVFDNNIALSAYPLGTADDSTKFLWSHLKPMGVGLMENIMSNIYTPYLVPSYVGGYIDDTVSPIRYRKPVGSKTVTIKGVTNNSLGASMVTDDVVFVLPTGYRPLASRTFISYNDFSGICVVRIKSNGEASIAGDIMAVSNIGCWMNINFDID